MKANKFRELSNDALAAREKELKAELKKVQWPGWKQVAKNTGIVIACVIVVGIFIWVFDALANAIVQALLNLFNPGA